MAERKQLIIVNTPSSQCDDASVNVMLVACATLMQHVCNLWERSSNIELLLRSQMVANNIPQAKDSIRILLVGSNDDISASLENEKNEGGGTIAVVFTKPIFVNHGSVFGSTTTPSIAAVLFQTICELIINPNGNVWWNDYVSGEFVHGMICAPVEGEPINVTVTIEPPASKRFEAVRDQPSLDDAELPALEDISDNVEQKINQETKDQPTTSDQQKLTSSASEPIKVNVTLCNFVLPTWFNPASPADTRLDFLGTIKEPFQISSSGCCLKYDPKSDTTPRFVFGRKMPGWKREEVKLHVESGNKYHLADQNANA